MTKNDNGTVTTETNTIVITQENNVSDQLPQEQSYEERNYSQESYSQQNYDQQDYNYGQQGSTLQNSGQQNYSQQNYDQQNYSQQSYSQQSQVESTGNPYDMPQEQEYAPSVSDVETPPSPQASSQTNAYEEEESNPYAF